MTTLTAVKERQQRTWASGDYSRIAGLVVPIADPLCEAVDLRAGEKVLDVATGSGNTALAAARRFCDVTGVDYVPSLLERARERARAERLDVTFVEGDAEEIPFPDAAFDVVLSSIGVMFAPDQEQSARELMRVSRPGGRIGLASWTPASFVGELFRVTGRHVPPPAGVRPPVEWGTEDRLVELFGIGIESLHAVRRVCTFRVPSAEFYVNYFRSYYGPTVKAFAALDAAGQEAFAADLRDAVEKFNRSDDGTIVLPAEYLEAVAIRR